MSFQIGTGGVSEIIKFLKPTIQKIPNIPDGADYGNYLYWDGKSYKVGHSRIKLGVYAGQNNQEDYTIAIGDSSGQTNQGIFGIAIGLSAGSENQSTGCIALGSYAGNINQGSSTNPEFAAIAIGSYAGSEKQGPGCVAIGSYSGESNQGQYSVSLGTFSGHHNQGQYSVSMGSYSGEYNQGRNCVAIGASAGQFEQGIGIDRTEPYGCCSVAVGIFAGQTKQGVYSVAIGPGAGRENQKPGSVAIGLMAGLSEQGNDSIAIGSAAGRNFQANKSIVINATGDTLDNTLPNTCKIAPLRDMNQTEDTYNTFSEPFVMSYSPSTSELTYNSNPQIRRNFGQGNELLLSDFNTVHYYTYTGSSLQNFDISTNMVENAVYEVTFNLSGSSFSNNDITFYPNYTSGGSLYTNYIQRLDSGGFQGNSTTSSGFSFDLVAGSLGYDPVGKITIFNNRNAKKIRSDIGDTFANSTGSGYWLTAPPSGSSLSYETITQWLTVGRISISPGSFTNAVVTVKRVA